MVEKRVVVQCYHCESERIVRNGMTRNGKQRYKCHDCGRCSREDLSPPRYSEERKAEILRAYQERSSLRGLERTFGVSRATVSSWLEKKTPNSGKDALP